MRPYSYRRAVVGSTRDARQAGTAVTTIAIAARSVAAEMYVDGSVAVTPKSSVDTRRRSAIASAMPMIRPTNVTTAP